MARLWITVWAKLLEDSEERLLIRARLAPGSRAPTALIAGSSALAVTVAGGLVLGPLGVLAGAGIAAVGLGAHRVARRKWATRDIDIEWRPPRGGAYREPYAGMLLIGGQTVPHDSIESIRVYNEEVPRGPLWTLRLSTDRGTIEVLPRYRAPWDQVGPIAQALADRIGKPLNP